LGKPLEALAQAANKLSEETSGYRSARWCLNTVSAVAGL